MGDHSQFLFLQDNHSIPRTDIKMSIILLWTVGPTGCSAVTVLLGKKLGKNTSSTSDDYDGSAGNPNTGTSGPDNITTGKKSIRLNKNHLNFAHGMCAHWKTLENFTFSLKRWCE